jgi:outer membrane protein assembly factor BamB
MCSYLRPLLLVLVAASTMLGENWPGFRGPSRQGISSEKRVPVRWSKTENVLWVQDVPGEAWSSPIVHGGRVFVTTATEDGVSGRVLCFDSRTGKPLWNREVVRQTLKRKEKKNSWASPTPVTDGRHVYAVFGDGTFAALDFNGKVVWINRDYPHYSQHGLGASPILEHGLLIMSRDASSEGEDKKVGWQKPWEESFLVALDAATGKERWRAKRGLSRIGHTTPVVTRDRGRSVIISSAGDVVQGFDLRTGKLLWTGRSQGEGVVPSPVFGDGVVFTASGFEKPTIRAFRLGGNGDVGAVGVVWEQTKGVPMISSMIFVAPYLYSVTTNGIVNVFVGSSGEMLQQLRIGGEHSASPVFADGRLYFSSEDGDVTVIEPGASPRILQVNRMEERIQASPAVAGGKLYLRTERKLYCISNP